MRGILSTRSFEKVCRRASKTYPRSKRARQESSGAFGGRNRQFSEKLRPRIEVSSHYLKFLTRTEKMW